MSTLTPSITRLKSMLALEEKRLALQHQIDKLQQEISAMGEQLFDGVVAAATKTAGKVSRKARAQRGALKEEDPLPPWKPRAAAGVPGHGTGFHARHQGRKSPRLVPFDGEKSFRHRQGLRRTLPTASHLNQDG